jgi:hypothetical protein
MEKKVVAAVIFEYYPAEDEYLTDNYPNITDEEMVEKFDKMLDAQLSQLDIPALWWHFDNIKIEVSDGKN